MANEQIVRQSQALQNQAKEQEAATDRALTVTSADVDRGIQRTMTTGQETPYAMTFEENGKSTPYVRKAGRSIKLNESAKKKGGLALMKAVCVRGYAETPERLQQIFQALPLSLQERFMESRGNDFRCFTLPANWSLYKYVIIFGSGEKWEGEGIAWTGNLKTKQLANPDFMAVTRAFNRTVGLALADGFITDDKMAGSEDVEADEPEDDGDEPAAHRSIIDVTPHADEQGAAPDGDAPFRSPDRGGAGGDAPDQGDAAGAAPTAAASGGPDPAGGGTPIAASGAGGLGQDDGHKGAPAQPTSAVDPAKLINLAQQKGIFTLKYAAEKFQREIKTLRELSGFELSVLRDDLTAMPDKPPRKEG